ncbi:RHS repeat domain-containing protein [Yersinia sp. LJYL362]|uniref:RHS repeat domain-containing protein n=1 Tax=Yersinia sp. LJYL362 TaxID=3402108 RepID=UPI003AB491FA
MNAAINNQLSHPTIAISDNRGLGIRALAYNRTDANPVADELISRNHYNARGQLIASRDARLEIDNFLYHYNLAGAALRTEGVDNGTLLQLTDIEGRPVMNLDAKGTRSWVTYEPALGRPLEHQQQAEGGIKTITDRFFYGENTEQHKAANLNGQCIRHYDTAGLQQVISLSIIGVPLQQQRQLLTDTLGPVDWFGEENASWASRLDTEPFITRCSTDALGQPLTQTDSKNHTQHMAYNRAGQLRGSWLILNGGIEQVIVKSLTYSAAGQKLWEESGNGVVTEYRYEAETQRLIGIKTTRPALKDRPTLLQDLRYDYDPVGNILAIHNDAEATRFYRNQKIVPETTYRYDALYQLIEATGRECDANTAQNQQSSALAELTDKNQLVNYTRRYTYDRAGNLLKIQHTGATQYTTHITVSHTSNHGIQQQDGLTAADIRSQFDAAGNQQQLQPGQPLQWDARNQLQQVITVKREAGNSANNDSESYLYGSDGMRIVKQSIQQHQTSKVLYLPGLELRTQHNNDNLTEDFQVITVGATGRAQVRVLLWQKGQPDGIDNGQLRYSFDNQIGSSLLELDNNGNIISQEEYYPFGGTAVFSSRNTIEAKYKTVRYSGKERDATGLYYYGFRYYMPWLGRWLNADPAGTIDGLNLYRLVRNNPITLMDVDGLSPITMIYGFEPFRMEYSLSKNQTADTPILRIDDLNLSIDLMERLKKDYTKTVSSLKNMGDNLNSAQNEHYKQKSKELMKDTGIKSQQSAMSLIMSWRSYLSQHYDELSLTSLIKLDKMSNPKTEHEATYRLYGFLNKNTPGKLRKKSVEKNTVTQFINLLNSNDPNQNLKSAMESNSDIGVAVINAFFRKVSKLSLDWSQLQPEIETVFIEGAFTDNVKLSPKDAYIQDNWRKFTSEDESALSEKPYKLRKRAATYFPITHSEMKHVIKGNNKIQRISLHQ